MAIRWKNRKSTHLGLVGSCHLSCPPRKHLLGLSYTSGQSCLPAQGVPARMKVEKNNIKGTDLQKLIHIGGFTPLLKVIPLTPFLSMQVVAELLLVALLKDRERKRKYRHYENQFTLKISRHISTVENFHTNELKRGVRDVEGLLKKPWCGTRYSSASTISSMSSSSIRVR